MFINDEACLLGRSASGEHNLLLSLFLREHGLRRALARQGKRLNGEHGIPDLFSSGKVLLEQKAPNRPAYVREFVPSRSLPGLARSYHALNAASRLARFMERNLLHMEHFEPAWSLLHRALGAMADKPLPEAALLKSMYLLAQKEGYAVTHHWLHGKAPNERQALIHVLQNPAEALEGVVERDLLESWIDDLGRFLEQETALLPP